MTFSILDEDFKHMQTSNKTPTFRTPSQEAAKLIFGPYNQSYLRSITQWLLIQLHDPDTKPKGYVNDYLLRANFQLSSDSIEVLKAYVPHLHIDRDCYFDIQALRQLIQAMLQRQGKECTNE